MNNPRLAKKNKRKCDYVILTPGEIKKLIDNGYQPHDLKPRGSKDDLFKCKPSGKVVVKRKTKYFDPKKDKWVFPGEDEIEDIGINITDFPWDRTMKTIREHTVIEFRITGFSKSPSDLLRELRIKGADSWKAGDARAHRTILKHTENGFRVRANRRFAEFEERVTRLIERVYSYRKQLAKLKAGCQLACVFYLSGGERPVVFFSKEILGRLAELGASLDVDFYYLGEEQAT